MKEFINNLQNINNVDEKLLNKIEVLKEQIENAKKEGNEAVADFLQKELDKLQKETNINNNLKQILNELEKLNTSSIPIKLDDKTKKEFKNISKTLNIKQGELLGLLIKTFVNSYYNN